MEAIAVLDLILKYLHNHLAHHTNGLKSEILKVLLVSNYEPKIACDALLTEVIGLVTSKCSGELNVFFLFCLPTTIN